MLEARFDTLSNTTAYARTQIAVLMRHEDDVPRVLRRLKRANPLPFLRDVGRKIGEPAQAVREAAGALTPELRAVLLALHTMLCDIRKHRDFEFFLARDMHLGAAQDAEVVAAYRLLLEPLLPPDEVAARTDELDERLRDHRVSLGCE